MKGFADRLAEAIRRCGTPAMVGLDPRLESLPKGLASGEPGDVARAAEAYERFCREVIDVVAPLVGVVKPQAAFFEQLGPAGLQALAGVVNHAREKGLVVVLDGKRNDIGSTATAYAQGYLGHASPWGADALTVSPYLGADSLQPFVDVAVERQAGIFVLVKTSNPGGGMIQDLRPDDRAVYEHVGAYVEQIAAQTAGECGYGVAGAVVGATYPEQLAQLRQQMPHAWLLVPGYGSQGGTARDVAAGFDQQGLGAVINNSRGILFAYRDRQYAHFGDGRWQDAVEAATRQMIEQLRSDTPAGKLHRG